MLEEHAKLVEFIHLAGEVSGRKKLQKMVYIAKKMKMPFHEKYEFHI
ncbi:MAG: YwgA family protein, partial [Planococcaceae bacterium]|nr:YwgA family protein [Planococcaceae bacterium]